MFYSYRTIIHTESFFLPFSLHVLLQISSQNPGWTLSVGRWRLCGPCGKDPSTRGGRRPISGGTTTGNARNVSSKAWLILPSSSNLEQQNVWAILIEDDGHDWYWTNNVELIKLQTFHSVDVKFDQFRLPFNIIILSC